MRVLEDLHQSFRLRGVRLVFCDVKVWTLLPLASCSLVHLLSQDVVRDVMDRFDFTEKLGPQGLFPTVHSAVEYVVNETENARAAANSGSPRASELVASTSPAPPEPAPLASPR
jgi:hypothetical protein